MKKLLVTIIFGICILFLASCSTNQIKKDAAEDIVETADFYCCEKGNVLTVLPLKNDEVVVSYDKTNYRMARAISASGARYAGDGLEWWSKSTGSTTEGVLTTSGTKEILTRCTIME